MFTKILLSVLLQAALVTALKGTQDIILKPVAGHESQPELCLVLVQGASIKPDSYVPLAKAIQNATNAKLWVGLPEFPLDSPIPVGAVFTSYVNAMLKELNKNGMPTGTPVIVAGHSLGGASLQEFSAAHPDQLQAQILLGSTILRKFYDTLTTPTLTLSGDLDGLMRITRMAETYAKFKDVGAPKRTVIVVPGMNHMDVASGAPPTFVKNHDLPSEISQEQAHQIIAEYVSEFILNVATGGPSTKITKAMADTGNLVDPLIKALQFEGSYHLNPPCDSDHPSPHCPFYPAYPPAKKPRTPSKDSSCTCGSPFVEQVAMPMMAGVGSALPSNFDLVNVDAFHPVSDVTPVHLPHIWNDCLKTGSSKCTLNTTTLTELVFDKLDGADTGYTHNSAEEIRCKMISRQRAFTHSVDPKADSNKTDYINICSQINAAGYKWALANAGAAALDRFNKKGTPYSFGNDKTVAAVGPIWIYSGLEYGKGNPIEIVSPTMVTDVNSTYIPGFPDPRGFHYCKLLSPARAMEHIYIDGLKGQAQTKTKNVMKEAETA